MNCLIIFRNQSLILSAAQAFYANNFQELKKKDLPALLQKLSSILAQMEVIVDPDILAQAPISAIHYSKNIPLKDDSTRTTIFKRLNLNTEKFTRDAFWRMYCQIQILDISQKL